MRAPSPPCDRLDLAHPWLTGLSLSLPIDYGPVLLRRTLQIPSCDGHPALRGTTSGEPKAGAVALVSRRSRRNIVSEHPAAVGVVESVNLRFKELWKNRSLVFPQLRHFPQRFSPAALRYAADRKRAAKCPRFSPLGRRTRSTNHCL